MRESLFPQFEALEHVMEITTREATEVDLPAVLSLYAQLGQDYGAVLSLEEA